MMLRGQPEVIKGGDAVDAVDAMGVLLMASGFWSLARPGSVAGGYVLIGLGALLFLSPWVLDYADVPSAAWTSWVVGALTVAVGGAAPRR